MKLYNPHDDPIHLGHGGIEYVLPANSDVEVPDEVGHRALVRHAETGVVELPGVPHLDVLARVKAEGLFTLYLKRRLGGPSSAMEGVYRAAQKRGLMGAPPEAPPEEKPAESEKV